MDRDADLDVEAGRDLDSDDDAASGRDGDSDGAGTELFGEDGEAEPTIEDEVRELLGEDVDEVDEDDESGSSKPEA